MMKQFQQIFDK